MNYAYSPFNRVEMNYKTKKTTNLYLNLSKLSSSWTNEGFSTTDNPSRTPDKHYTQATERTRKQWNRKTTLFDVFTKQIVLLDIIL